MTTKTIRIAVPAAPEVLEAVTNVVRVWFPEIRTAKAREFAAEAMTAALTTAASMNRPVVQVQDLSARQAEFLQTARDLMARNGGRIPNMAEIGRELGQTRAVAMKMCRRLHDAGHIRLRVKGGRRHIIWIRPEA